MFNNLNPTNNQSHSAVDDIFAETDKPTDNAQANSHGAGQAASAIDTHKVGLASGENISEELSSVVYDNKWFKIVLGVLIAAVLLLGGYLVYRNFFSASVTNPDITPEAVAPKTDNSSEVKKTPEENGSFVAPTGGSNETTSNSQAGEIPSIPGVNTPAVKPLGTDTLGATSSEVIPPVNSSVDSDNDGLVDVEERLAGTNINVIDTDGDTLSDYEEVKIYQTNPLSADSDGDSYLDGAEVKNGYNPNGPGKMPATASSTPTI
ncbi:MAG: hypothetical protein WC863_03155 [Patescibacteria group bacterium]